MKKKSVKLITLMYYQGKVVSAFRSRAAANRLARVLVEKDNYLVSKFYFEDVQVL